MEESRRKTKLSKNLLQMKFMKRTALRSEENEIEQQRKYEEDAEHWTVPDLGRAEKLVVVEPSYQAFENLRYGRMSFKGFNLAVEKMMQAQDNELKAATIDRSEKLTAVSDDEMTERYNSLIHTMDRKFAKKRKRGGQSTPAQQLDRVQQKRQKKWSKMASRESGCVEEAQVCVEEARVCVEEGPFCVEEGPLCVEEGQVRRQKKKLKGKFKKPSD